LIPNSAKALIASVVPLMALAVPAIACVLMLPSKSAGLVMVC
jgi:hypothetical protein